MKKIVKGVFGLVLGVAAAGVAQAVTLSVTVNGNDDAAVADTTFSTAFASIEKAIECAPENAEIVVGDGTYHPLQASSTAKNDAMLTIKKPLTVRSANGKGKVTIDLASLASGQSCGTGVDMRFAYVTAEATIDGFTVTGANEATRDMSGMAVYMTAGTIKNVVVKGLRSNNRSKVCYLAGTSAMEDCELIGPYTLNGIDHHCCALYLGGSARAERIDVHGFQFQNYNSGGNTHAAVFVDGKSAVLRNAFVHGNKNCASYGAKDMMYTAAGVELLSGTVENCTIVDNYTSGSGAGLYVSGSKDCHVVNTIVWGNVAQSGEYNDIKSLNAAGACSYTCASDVFQTKEPGEGNVNADPQLLDDGSWKPGPYSVASVVDAGLSTAATAGEGATDLAGEAREIPAGKPDMGCFEYVPTGETVPLKAVVSLQNANGKPTLTVVCRAVLVGDTTGVAYSWDFGDGSAKVTDSLTPTHDYAEPGAYTVTFACSSASESPDPVVLENAVVVIPKTCYVSTTGTPVAPYASWDTAARTLADALALGTDEIVVGPGTYDNPSPAIEIKRPLVLRSSDGPEETIVRALNSKITYVRNLDIANENAYVSGITFENAGDVSSFSDRGYVSALVMSAGTVSNCVFRKIKNTNRAAACSLSGTAKLFDCDIDGTGMTQSAGDARYSGLALSGSAVADRCRIHGFKYTKFYLAANEGFDKPNASQNKAAVFLNSKDAVLRNSLVDGNTNGDTVGNLCTVGGVQLHAGTVENCTIVNNQSGNDGGGIWITGTKDCALVNTIIWGNKSLQGNYYDNIRCTENASAITYCCSPSFDKVAGGLGVGCTTKDPQFSTSEEKGPYHPSALSAASIVDAGKPVASAVAEGALDLDRNPRANPADKPDIGCYEYQFDEVLPLTATVDVTGARGRTPLEVSFEATVLGTTDGLVYSWDFGDGTAAVTDTLTPTHTYETAGSYTVTLTLRNATETPDPVVKADAVLAVPETCYVSTNGLSRPPYKSWTDAARSIEDAVALEPALVLVSNGTYRTPSPSLSLERAVEVRSVEGPSKTVLRPAYVDKNTFFRNVDISADGAVLSGFSLENGGCNADDLFRGSVGAVVMSAGTLTNCWIRSIHASNRAPACRLSGSAKMVDCDIDGTGMGYGATDARLAGIALYGDAVVDRCRIHGFQLDSRTGLDAGAVNNASAVYLESAGAVLRNSLVFDNKNGRQEGEAYTAAGVELRAGTIENCTISDNVTGGQPGGLWVSGRTGCSVVNTVVWGNTAKKNKDADEVLFADAAFSPVACCYSRDPKFDAENPYHLTYLSRATCVDKGVETAASALEGALDLDGASRVTGETVDIGCFEYVPGENEPFTADVLVGTPVGRAPLTVAFEATVIGDATGVTVVWDFGDGSDPEEGTLAPSHEYVHPGAYTVTVDLANAAGKQTRVALTNAVVAAGDAAYVSASSANPVAPYLNWETAATNVQDAVDLAPATVWVGDGLYPVRTRAISLTRPVRLRSANGPKMTTLKAMNAKAFELRHEAASVEGFTLVGGVQAAASSTTDPAVFLMTAGTVTNCEIRANGVGGNGSGLYFIPLVYCSGGRLVDSVFSTGVLQGNIRENGALQLRLDGEALMDRCVITNCIVRTEDIYGGFNGFVRAGGASTVRNCLFADNRFESTTSFAANGILLAAENATVENCTFADNFVCPKKGGALGIDSPGGLVTVRNCLFADNVPFEAAGTVADYADAQFPTQARPTFTYSCSRQFAAADLKNGNISADPLLRRKGRCPLMPKSNSPAVDFGCRLNWMDGAKDLLGNDRIRLRIPDMGCYEAPQNGFRLFVR